MPGAVGRNWVERTDGTREEFGATCQVDMRPGDVFVIETPGGGGFGATAAVTEQRLTAGGGRVCAA